MIFLLTIDGVGEPLNTPPLHGFSHLCCLYNLRPPQNLQVGLPEIEAGVLPEEAAPEEEAADVALRESSGKNIQDVSPKGEGCKILPTRNVNTPSFSLVIPPTLCFFLMHASFASCKVT